jgi:hypothetical protein
MNKECGIRNEECGASLSRLVVHVDVGVKYLV